MVVVVVVVVVAALVVVVVVVVVAAAAAAAAAAGGGGALLLKIQNGTFVILQFYEVTHLLAFLVVDPHTLSFLGGSCSKLLSLNNCYRLCTNWVWFWLHRGPSPEGKHLVVLFGFTEKKKLNIHYNMHIKTMNKIGGCTTGHPDFETE